ncbi:unnamed protein product [Rhizophagus irregularis]|uniref:MATA-HMG n=1 Tax=Rhizophagus irregularis TaxID=588596 RepID=A0A1B1ETQ7_9GLOM|nr:MATA-HMG [Rhizophagus irregularis]CAB4377594.1 unnamed protein product [Rhizophagus irregularis]CAB5384998.1 unnamed protein product [Rhizophagus irregularis]
MNLIFHDELISSQELHPLLRCPPYDLTLSVAELTTPKTPKERQINDNSTRVTDPEEDVIIPRPHNAFIIFRNDYAARMKTSPEKKVSIRLISQMASKQWKQQTDAVKLFFKILADMYQHKHRILYPDYKYSPRFNSARKSRRRKIAKAKKDDLKNKKKGRIITWYIHDNTDKDLQTDKKNDNFRYTDLNISNPRDTKIETLGESPFKQRNYPPATFINYTATPTTPLVLHSTTTTCSQPILPPINFHPYGINNGNSLPFYDIINNNISNDNNDNGSDSASSYYDDNALSPMSFIPIEPMETLSPRSSPPSDECLFWTEHPNNNEREIPTSPFGTLFDNQPIFDI